jgi:GT2 family glycosyltransferase
MTALLAQTKTDFAVRIVDNASTGGSLRYVPADGRFLVIHAERNVGFAAGSRRFFARRRAIPMPRCSDR